MSGNIKRKATKNKIRKAVKRIAKAGSKAVKAIQKAGGVKVLKSRKRKN